MGKLKSGWLKTFTALIFPFILFCIAANGQDLDSLIYYYNTYNYKEVIARTSNEKDTDLLFIRAKSLKALRKYQEAAALFMELSKSDSLNVSYYVEIAESFGALGNYETSREYYLRALKFQPSNTFLIQNLADINFAYENYAEAKKYYLLAIKQDSGYYFNRQTGRCYEELKVYDSAIYYFKASLKINPDDFQTVYRLANIYKETDDYKSGYEVTDTYLEKDSVNLRMLKLSGFLHFLDKEYETANLRFGQCVILKDSSDFLNTYYGLSLYRVRDFDEAKFFLEKAFSRDTLNANICFALGVSCSSSYYKKLGIYYLEKTIELLHPDPGFLSIVYAELATAYSGYSRQEDALEALFKAYEVKSKGSNFNF